MPLSVDSKLFTFEVFLVKDDRLRSDGTTGELLCAAMELLPYFLGLGSAVRVEGGSLLPLAEISRSRLLETVGLLDVPACRKMLELDICYNSTKIRKNGNTKFASFRASVEHAYFFRHGEVICGYTFLSRKAPRIQKVPAMTTIGR